MNFTKAQKYITNKLSKELPDGLYYHGVHHTLDVLDATIRLAKMEGVSRQDTILLKTAALYHDAGFIYKYFNNEEVGVKIAKKSLPLCGYTPKQIKIVCSLIMATKIEAVPVNHLEEIIRDADLDYLGRNDFYPIANNLKKELFDHGLKYNGKQWRRILVDFLGKHRYYTKSARKMREARKRGYLNTVKKMDSITEQVTIKLQKELVA